MTVVTKQMQSSWERKRKENETKFLETAKTELNRVSAQKIEEFVQATKKMDCIYARFLMEYASVSDDIRRVMVALLDEHKQFLELTQKKHKTMEEGNQERDKGHVKSLAMTKKAVQDCDQLIYSLNPSV